MLQVSANGVWCDTLRVDNDDAVLVSFFGPRNATRAVWARSMRGVMGEADRRGNRKRSGLTGFGDGNALLATGAWSVDQCSTIQCAAPTAEVPDNLHVVLAHWQATSRANLSKTWYVIGEPGMEKPDDASWFPRWNRAFEVPAMAAWAPQLWDKGVELGLIRDLPGYGRPVWRFRSDGYSTKHWAGAVKTLVLAQKAAQSPFMKSFEGAR